MNEHQYSDYSSIGEIDSKGGIRLLMNREAVENSLRLWITSFRGEIIKRPTMGGIVLQWLMKPMSMETARNIKNAIIDGLANDFQPVISISSLSVVPNYEKQYWEIELIGYCPLIQDEISYSDKLRRLTS